MKKKEAAEIIPASPSRGKIRIIEASSRPTTFEGYVKGCPAEVRKRLETIRKIVQKTAPTAVEVISYGMPGYKLNGMLLWFAAHTNHIGFYPKASGIIAFKKELSAYKGSTGSVRFPLDSPLPVAVIEKIVKFRTSENLEKAKKKSK